MNRKLITGSIILYSILCSVLFFAQFPIYSYAAEDFSHPGNSDTPEFIENLVGTEITWKILNASGVFADEDLQPNDMIKYIVEDINLKDSQYEVKIEKKGWDKNDFKKQSGTYTGSYFLIRRNWGEASVEYFLPQHSQYWGSYEQIDREFVASYQTEWWDWKMMNTATITYKMNKTNYDIAKYSRAEGILLERKTVVNLKDGEKGFLDIVLVSYSGFFELSPWYYIIVISIIVGLIAIVIMTISLLIQKRKRIYREINEL